MGTSRAAKAASHDRILDIASARIRRYGIDSLAVAELMKDGLIDNPDREVREREAVHLLSALVGAVSMARAVDDPELSQQMLTNAAAALKERLPS